MLLRIYASTLPVCLTCLAFTLRSNSQYIFLVDYYNIIIIYKSMRWSKVFIPTRKEVPSEAESVSHKLMLRAGLIKKHASGIYSYLPLGWKVLTKIQNIVRREMNRIGAQELLMPALTPSSMWKETGRWDEFGDEMFRLKDRKNSDMALAPTHEEVITAIVKDHIDSYREMPQSWYQIQVKYRDEMRPRGAVLRARSFIMKDSYSMDTDFEGLKESYNKHREAYRRIFKSCGLHTVEVKALSGLMGGSESEQFNVLCETGEDVMVTCPECGYAANLEASEPLPSTIESLKSELKEVHTPVDGSVESISNFLNVSKSRLMKSLLYIKNEKPVWVIIRGDYEIDESKLEEELGEMRIATEEEVKEITGTTIGYVSPVGSVIPVYADLSIKNNTNFVSGANRQEYHYTGIDPERDLNIKKYVNIRELKEGDLCPECKNTLIWKNAIEVGQIFQLGTKYSKAMGATYLNEEGKEKPIVMGSYGIGIERIMASAIEQHHDENGIIWPESIAPYDIIILNLNPSDNEGVEISDKVYKIVSNNYKVLYDDRDVQAGYKFKDADLIGIPYQIIIGSRGLERGIVELKERETYNVKKIKINEILKKGINL